MFEPETFHSNLEGNLHTPDAIKKTSHAGYFSADKSPELNRYLPKSPDFISAAEAEFLARWSCHLNPEKWDRFLVAWARALEVTGTSTHFLDSLQMDEIELRCAGEAYEAVLSSFSSRFKERDILIEKFPDAISHDISRAEELGLKVLECALCQRGFETVREEEEKGEIPFGILEASKDFILLPNRFPWDPGGLVLFARRHDDLSARFIPDEKEDYIVTEMKTRGALPSAEMLRMAMHYSEKYDLIAARNHAVDGMSIPFHDHYHAFPSDLPKGKLMRMICAETAKPSRSVQIGSSLLTPFDSCILSSSNHDLLAERVAEVCRALESDNQVFSIVYYDDVVKICPRREGIERVANGGTSIFALL